MTLHLWFTYQIESYFLLLFLVCRRYNKIKDYLHSILTNTAKSLVQRPLSLWEVLLVILFWINIIFGRIIHKFISFSGSLAMNKGFVVWQIIAGLKICNDIAEASSSTFGKTWSIQADPWFMEKLNKRDLHKKWVVAPVAFAPAQFCTEYIEYFSKTSLLKVWILRSTKMSQL